MTNINKATRAANCPLDLEVCFSSCYWRSGNKCTFCQRYRRQRCQMLNFGYLFRYQPVYARN